MRRILASLLQIKSFTPQELQNEQRGSVVSSDVVFFGAFAALNDMLIAPNPSIVGLFNAELIVNKLVADVNGSIFIHELAVDKFGEGAS